MIRFLLAHYDIPMGTEWFILLQGCSNDHITKVQSILTTLLTDGHSQQIHDGHLLVHNSTITIHLLLSPTNLGLSKGMNILNVAVRDFKYVLLLEDDWIALPTAILETTTLLPRDWISLTLNFLDYHPTVSTIFLRRYRDEKEKNQFGWSRGIPYRCHHHQNNFNYADKMKGSWKIPFHSLSFQQIPDFLFTFNPHIRRNEDYYRANVFPLPEFADINSKQDKWTITKEGDCPDWGSTEALSMEKTRHLVTFNMNQGVFGHFEDFEQILNQLPLFTTEENANRLPAV